ncbi:hypothetical protein [cf. Phormidesmis sp. LEGE 11477]|uniref:hypothetical protein n=1 Tax=cf. Phormidesmis sp. LEGE 11477 TaxID=1828680 RepID=UPI00187F3739|nr:hypothetical protein [cf. Phormidesmis sp. LEGE 11477]MBE9060034.1 hypothetical protein [cf. Phormidesmis sp. LEGE 11477]
MSRRQREFTGIAASQLSNQSAGQLTHQSVQSDAALKSRPSSQIQPVADTHLLKPLLHILDDDENPGDMVNRPKQIALQGQKDVYIARAEIELRRAMQALSFLTDSEINSISTLTALSLPQTVAPLFWTINALLQEKYAKPNDPQWIHNRNRDARVLFQQIANLNLTPWSKRLVDYVRPEDLPSTLLFPIGHPILGRTYRRHPFKARINQYYPVTDYFSILFKEREQALLSLLGQLGATKIVMTPIPATTALSCQENLAAQLHQKVFRYPKRSNTLPETINVKEHPWVAGEPAWQSVIKERVKRGALSAQFEFDCDVMDMLTAQIQKISQMIPGLSSMKLPDDHADTVMTQVLHTRQVQVEFAEVGG